MATAADGPPATPARLRAALPWAGLILWAAGAVGLFALGRRYGWSAGELVLAGCGWLVVLAAAARDAVRHLFGPVFVYEIRRLGRRKSTFVLRGLYVVAVCGLLLVVYVSWLEDAGYFNYNAPSVISPQKLSNFASRFFYQFQFLQFAVLAFITPAYVAGSIADEKEKKTLEFLLATDLRNREIVFGKLAARVATLLAYILAGLPVLAFLQLFGGIDPDLLLTGTAASAITVVGLSAWSICLSALMKRARDAIALTYLSFAVYLIGSMMAAILIRKAYGTATFPLFGYTISPSDFTDRLADGNALFVLFEILESRGFGSATWLIDTFGRYALWWAVATALLLVVAVGQLRAVALRQAYGGHGGRRKERAARLRPTVGQNPVFWREVFVEGSGRRGAVGWLMAILVVGLVFSVPVVLAVAAFGDMNPWLSRMLELYPKSEPFPTRWRHFVDGMNIWVRVATGGVGLLVLLAAALRGAGTITGERDRDTWVSLVSTPLSSWEMLVGKWWGCVLGLRRQYLALLTIWASGLIVGAFQFVMLPFLLLTTAVYVSAFAWIGIYCSLTAKRTIAASVAAMSASVFLLGGFWIAVFMCCVLPLELMFRGSSARDVEHILNNLAQLLLGGTPPFVLGWLPLWDFRDRDLLPFDWSASITYPVFGPLAPIFGVTVWGLIAIALAVRCHQKFRRLANRDSEPLHLPAAPIRRTAEW